MVKPNNNNILTFFSGKKELRSLSNFHENDIMIDGLVFKSGEHAFHYMKYKLIADASNNPERQTELQNYSLIFIINNLSCLDAKRAGGKRGLALTQQELEIWNSKSISVQKQICCYKFNNDEIVKKDLKSSIGKILIHPAPRCKASMMHTKLWEGRAIIDDNGNIEILGKNMLGQIWMNIRDYYFPKPN